MQTETLVGNQTCYCHRQTYYKKVKYYGWCGDSFGGLNRSSNQSQHSLNLIQIKTLTLFYSVTIKRGEEVAGKTLEASQRLVHEVRGKKPSHNLKVQGEAASADAGKEEPQQVIQKSLLR